MTIAPITTLSPSGEVARFIDDDQFNWGLESTMKCGPEAVSLFWHSLPPGQANPYKAADIHAMAHNDYVKFVGSDVPSDQGGTSNQMLYSMLSYHNFHYVVLPNDTTTLDRIRAWLRCGYPVICGVVEASVWDKELGRCPYPWNTSGLTHIITATGLSDWSNTTTSEWQWIRFRDTANVEFNGAPNILRPGPRQYDITKLQLTSATVVIPSWMEVPPVNFDPRTVIPPPAPTDEFSLWTFYAHVPLNPDSAIYKSWLAGYYAGRHYGPPLGPEHNVAGKTVQEFWRGRAEWEPGASVSWFDGRGLI